MKGRNEVVGVGVLFYCFINALNTNRFIVNLKRKYEKHDVAA